MTTTIKIDKAVIEEKEKSSDFVQYIPCSINSNGETDINRLFNKFTKENKEKNCLTNSLRGYPLEGTKMTLPSGYTGLVVEAGREALMEVDKDVRVTKAFDTFTYWNYDRVPGEADTLQQALQWIEATKPGDKIGVCYSGGVGSNSLLHLIYDGINSDHKKLLFVPMVIHVDEGGLEGKKEEDRVDAVDRIRGMANKFGFQFYFCVLEDFMKEEVRVFGDEEKMEVECKAEENLQKLFLSVGENSGKEDLLVSLRRLVLVKAGRTLGCSKLFTGENGTNLAVDLLSGVSSGRGAGLPHITGFRDTRDDIVVMRPMRDISSKEVALYSQFHNLDSEVVETLGTKENGLYSIRKLTEEFVTELQADFPSTVSTIFRTGDKLLAQENQEEEGCVLCGGPIDTDCPVTCAFQATKWSQLVSEKGKPGLDDMILEVGRMENITVDEMDRIKNSRKILNEKKPGGGCGSGGGDCCGGCDSKGGSGPSVKQVEREMCYSCRLVVKKVKDVDVLPAQVLKEVMVRNRRRDMEAEIQDFLLE